MTPKSRLRNKADRLAKERAFEKYGKVCELCGSDFRATAHHFFYRSSCGHLRHEIDNLVILCGYHHALLHFKDPKLVEGKIIKLRGQKWFNKLQKRAYDKPTSSYLTTDYYLEVIKELDQ